MQSYAAVMNAKNQLGRIFGDEKEHMPDLYTRHMGGEFRKNQPYISGFHHVLFILPEALFDDTAETSAKWLTSTCESFTPHSITPNFVDVTGQGQIGASFMVNKTINREFTLAFREYQNLPITSIIDTWLSVFDEHTGVSTFDHFVPSNYKGACIVYQMKPTIGSNGTEKNIKFTPNDVEEIHVYSGVVPKSHPRDTIGPSDQTTNDTVQISTTFSFDGAPLTRRDEITERAVELLNAVGGEKKYSATYQKYLDNFKGDGGGNGDGGGSSSIWWQGLGGLLF